MPSSLPARHDERATIDDVARRAGVSTATVSRVLNGSGKVAESTFLRVQEAMEALNYHPNTQARGLATRRTHTLGLTLDEFSGGYLQHLLRGIHNAANAHGYDLLLHATPPRTHTRVGGHNTDGLIIVADNLSDRELIDFHIAHFPVVLLHRSSPPGLNIPCVTVENKAGARALIDHLIERCGARRIAYLRGPKGHEDSYWREIGYRESLAAHGLPFVPALIWEGGFDLEHARAAIRRWLTEASGGPGVDAIFAGDDDSAIGVILALTEAGFRVPEDVAVVGFDDIDLAQYFRPPLTTVRAPIEAAGAEAVRQLVKLINTGDADPLTLLPTQLVVRDSCGSRLRR
jgi:DNA-binding LacI/PurR family transcriptional regulator